MASHYDPRRALGARAMSLTQWLIILIPVSINMVDGYDILALAQAAPVLAREWRLGPDRLGELLSFSLAGMAAGALGVSPVADTKGRRPAILFCLLMMSAGMFGAALSQGYWTMAAASRHLDFLFHPSAPGKAGAQDAWALRRPTTRKPGPTTPLPDRPPQFEARPRGPGLRHGDQKVVEIDRLKVVPRL